MIRGESYLFEGEIGDACGVGAERMICARRLWVDGEHFDMECDCFEWG